MGKKWVVLGGAAGALLLLGGVFLFLGSKPKVPHFKPIVWGQEKDYSIVANAQGEVTVTNTKEKYSFAVPKGWRVDNMQGVLPEEFLLDILSPDAVLSDNNVITQGCRILLETVYDEQEVQEIQSTMSYLRKDGGTERSSLVNVDGLEADRAVYISKEDAEKRSGLPTFTIIRVPLSKEIALEYRIHAVPDKSEQCLEIFSEFSDSVRFK
ncbi:MAG: hypothetical protein HYW98_00455 [Candidatus Wildermuthbacteria bacterium]|nr:hypothetical protein [Candidatus Wildermuthbacteria bacterium]